MNRNRLGTSSLWRVCGAVALVVACALPAAAQTTVSSTDIQRLQDQVYEASSDISRLRSSNSDMAARLQSELDDLRDEVVYLKVKMRKEGNVNRNDYADVRDKLSDLRTRARSDGRHAKTRELGAQASLRSRRTEHARLQVLYGSGLRTLSRAQASVRLGFVRDARRCSR